MQTPATVTVKLFGPQAALAGRREVAVVLTRNGEEAATAGGVLAGLGEAVPALRGSLAQSRLAVNREFAAAGDAVRPGDEVALIGMVSGG